MDYFLAILPILIVLGIMVFFRWSGQRAGPIGWLFCLVIAIFAFGLNWDVFWVSQVKGILLALNVLAVLWSALYLYNIVEQIGGARAIAKQLQELITDKGLLLLVLAWVFSGLIEGLAGFGVPIAIVAPMLVTLGVPPQIAVAAPAVGHAWAVTFGNMGLVLQTLVSVTKIDAVSLAPTAAFLLGIACLGCGLGVAIILKQARRWPIIILLSICMAAVQYLLVVSGLGALGSFFAALTGIAIIVMLDRKSWRFNPVMKMNPALSGALLAYGIAIIVMVLVTIISPLNRALVLVVWKHDFPEVITQTGLITPAGPGQVFHPLIHPGVLIFLSTLASYLVFRRKRYCSPGMWRQATAATYSAAGPASIGIISMVGLSTLMDHCGMTILLAKGLSQTMGATFPLVSSLVGMLGAFATGSNTNSNVLFAPMQQETASLLGIKPVLLVSAQTVGGSLGSMIAPAKLAVGCSTTGLKGRDGEALRYTLPISLVIGMIIGVVTWLMIRF